MLTCSWVQICSWTVVHCGSLVVEHFCSFTVSHFCRDGTKGQQANIFKRVFLFNLFVDGLSDGVALLLRPLLALGLVLRAAHTVLHRLALLPAQDKDIMRQQLFFYIMSSSFRGSSNYYCIFVTARSVRFNLSLLVVVAAIFKSLPLSCCVINVRLFLTY